MSALGTALQNPRENMRTSLDSIQVWRRASELRFPWCLLPPSSTTLLPALLWSHSFPFLFWWPTAELMLQVTVCLHPIELARAAHCSGCQGLCCSANPCSDPADLTRSMNSAVQLNCFMDLADYFPLSLGKQRFWRFSEEGEPKASLWNTGNMHLSKLIPVLPMFWKKYLALFLLTIFYQ